MPDPNNYTPIDEVEEWKATIPALQDGWPPNGGPVDPANNGGLLNWPLLHLASRTLWLKAQAEQLANDLANIDVSAQINAAIDALVNGAPAALDTLSELATALQDNDDQVAALVASIAGKLSKDQNLADLTNVAEAWNNLYIKSGASYDVTDNPNLSVNPGQLPTRGNVAAAIADGQVGLGIGQTWQDVLASRAINTVYQNTGPAPIGLLLRSIDKNYVYAQTSTDGATWSSAGTANQYSWGATHFTVVPRDQFYQVTGSTPLEWQELR